MSVINDHTHSRDGSLDRSPLPDYQQGNAVHARFLLAPSMATFGKTNFNTVVYAASRPTYPQALYDFVFDFHRRSLDAKFDRAVDLGCGTGEQVIARRMGLDL